MPLTYQHLSDAIAGGAVGVRARTRLEPMSGPGGKVLPPTYSSADKSTGPRYATETRRRNNNTVRAVALNSVAANANVHEAALALAVDYDELHLPLVVIDFPFAVADGKDRLSSLEVSHRIFDATLRDGELDGQPFRHSPIGKAICAATPRNAAALFTWAPTSLLFGCWNSTGPAGGHGAKFPRALVTEIDAIGIETGSVTSSRIDPLRIPADADMQLYASADPQRTFSTDLDGALHDQDGKPVLVGKDSKSAGRPAAVNHGNIPPAVQEQTGGVTADTIELTTVISFPALRRFRFPAGADGQALPDRRAAESAAWAALAALGIVSVVLTFEAGFDLRARCALWAQEELTFELLGRGGQTDTFQVTRAEALSLLGQAVTVATDAGLSWPTEPVVLQAAPELCTLIRHSHERLTARQVKAKTTKKKKASTAATGPSAA